MVLPPQLLLLCLDPYRRPCWCRTVSNSERAWRFYSSSRICLKVSPDYILQDWLVLGINQLASHKRRLRGQPLFVEPSPQTSMISFGLYLLPQDLQRRHSLTSLVMTTMVPMLDRRSFKEYFATIFIWIHAWLYYTKTRQVEEATKYVQSSTTRRQCNYFHHTRGTYTPPSKGDFTHFTRRLVWHEFQHAHTLTHSQTLKFSKTNSHNLSIQQNQKKKTRTRTHTFITFQKFSWDPWKIRKQTNKPGESHFFCLVLLVCLFPKKEGRLILHDFFKKRKTILIYF